MTGSSVFEYVHVQDQQELAEQLGLQVPRDMGGPAPTLHSPQSVQSDDGSNSAPASTPRALTPTERASIMNPSVSRGFERSFCIRMKSTLTKRGVHVKCAGYRVVQILSHMRPQVSFSMARKHPPPILGLVAMAIALPPPTVTELLIDNDMFVSRLSPELKITYVEPRLSDMMDMNIEDITNKNLYDFCHAEDLQKLRKSHIDLLNKGQVLTDYYRIMNKHGGYVWIQTCATIICNSKNVDDQNIIAINYVLSGIEYPGCVMNMNQLRTMMNGGGEPDDSDRSDAEDSTHRGHHRSEKSPSACDEHDADTSQAHNKHPAAKTGHTEHMVSSLTDMQRPASPPPADILYHNTDNSINTNSIHSFPEDVLLSSDRKDAKNSRRKMDKPRKRKRDHESESDENSQLGATFNSAHNVIDDINSVLRNESKDGTGLDMSESENITAVKEKRRCNQVTSERNEALNQKSVPEDLSVKGTADSQSLSNTNNSSGSSDLGDSFPARGTWSPPCSAVVTSGVTGAPATSSSSVRDLEEVMNKHLPASSNTADTEQLAGADYGLLGGSQKHKSTIQWIGSHTGPDGLPATNLLRSLYASRESVIRSNVYNPRAQYYNSASDILTPPSIAATEAQLSQGKIPSPVSTYYPNSTLAMSMTAAAANMSGDTYSMTPPSSVSPQDKYPYTADHTAPPVAAENGQTVATRGHFSADSIGMPIKPQAYTMPNPANSSAYERATGPASQYGAYFGSSIAFPSYAHSASPTAVPYRDMDKSSTTW